MGAQSKIEVQNIFIGGGKKVEIRGQQNGRRSNEESVVNINEREGAGDGGNQQKTIRVSEVVQRKIPIFIGKS